MLCLVANAASGAFGAIGIPVGVVDTHLPVAFTQWAYLKHLR